KEVAFWKSKLDKQPKGFLYIDKMASAYETLFELTGEVTYLKIVDSLYQTATSMTDGKWKTSYRIALASNAIKRHQFKASLDYSYIAKGQTDEKFGPLMMLFDAYMELGHYESAYYIMRDNQRLDSFDYLVRLSKYQDHVGDLDSAIQLMETAFDMVKHKNSDVTLWAETNLADMYGHDGQLNKSYRHYLNVLRKEPDYRHAIKGIAWMAYANDDNLVEAKRLFQELNQRTQLPDAYLMLAEMAEYESDSKLKNEYLDKFMGEASQEKYKGMYNKYLITLLAEEEDKYDEAIALAQKEVRHRATPLTYSLLAWCHEQKGDHETALRIMQEHVAGKTFEPQVLYYLGVTFFSNGKIEQGIDYLEEAADASYELGPVTANKISNYLKAVS
ncbi:MAG: hypothetical protein AAFN93_02775, partial [Bacteroidota bacterium]